MNFHSLKAPREKISARDAVCQKCLEKGHWTYQCTKKRKILLPRSRTKHIERVRKAVLNRAQVPTKEKKQNVVPPEKRLPAKLDESSSSSSSSSDSSDSSSSDSSSSTSSSDELD